jgi:hypothetical protein
VAQDDGDELLRPLILAVLAKADRPIDAEEPAETELHINQTTRRSAQMRGLFTNGAPGRSTRPGTM